MNLNKYKIINILWPIGLVFMNLTFYYYGTFPINISFLVLLIIFFLYFPICRIHTFLLISYLLFCVVILINGVFARDLAEYANSAAQLILFFGPAMILGASFPQHTFRHLATSINLLLAFSVFAALIIVVQFVFFNILQDYRFAAPLGPFQPRGPGGEIYVPHTLALLKRPSSLYSEPSIEIGRAHV